MAQPFDRKTTVSAAGSLDKAAGQFWVGQPWSIVTEGKNLSAYERNRSFLNLGGNRFVDVSFLTGTDSDGDGRSAIAADLNGDGMQDLIVRQAGGGPLLIYLNRFPPRHYLRVSLRGTKSNGLGVGARVIAEAGGRRIVRDLFPANGFVSQTPHEVYFGLDQATQVDRLTIRWPSGITQELSPVASDQHIYVRESESDELASVTSSAKPPR